MTNKMKWVVLIGALMGIFFGRLIAQQSNSGGGLVTIVAAIPAGTNVIGHVINDASSAVIGHVINDSGSTTAVTGNVTAVQGTGSNLHVQVDTAPSTAVTNAGTFATQSTLAAGTAVVGMARILPAACTQTTPVVFPTVGVATGAGTSVTSTTTCATMVYANNITNSAVTLRVQDKAGTPVIWIGGNSDFSIPANSSVNFPVAGVTFTSGITAIAGTASAINLQINGMQ